MGASKRLLMTGVLLALAEYGLAQNKIKVEIGTGTIYQVPQERAEWELAKLSKKTEKEDSWVSYKGRLIDNGKNESPSNVTMHFPLIIKNYRDNTIDTILFYIPSGDTITLEHIHPFNSPPSIIDIANQSLLLDSVFTDNIVIPRVAANGKMWEFHIENFLRNELRGKNREERLKLLESKVNIAYTPENKFMFGDKYPYPYSYNPKSDKKYKKYVSIMKEVGVTTRYWKPRRCLLHK
jgi:hypothetical protein